MSELNERVEAFARILAAIESRKSGWGFTLDQATEYRAEKWRRHVYEAEQLLDEMGPWLAEHDRQVAERAWDGGYDAALLNERQTLPFSTITPNPYRAVKGEPVPIEEDNR